MSFHITFIIVMKTLQLRVMILEWGLVKGRKYSPDLHAKGIFYCEINEPFQPVTWFSIATKPFISVLVLILIHCGRSKMP